MSLPTTLPYVGSATENLTLSDPRCNSDACKAFYEGHQQSQKNVSYNHQYDYGHYVTWFYLACVGVLIVVYLSRCLVEHRVRKGHVAHEFVSPSLKSKAQAALRMVAYRRVPGGISDRFGLPSLGILLFMGLVLLYLLCLTFWAKPYYRLYRGYGSPPIGVRTGLMAVATTPLLIALSGKANLVTLLTGIGHEKLNVFHRWVGWITFGLSVAHTIPFIIAPLQMPFGGAHALHRQYYKKGSLEYTGTPPLAILFGLLLFSVPWLRHRMYEVFYHLHFWLAITYVGLMFWHATDEGDSWVYLWASITVWLISIVARTFYYTRPINVFSAHWAIGASISTRTFSDNMSRLEIIAPDGFHWKPGQHVYVRVPQLNILDNHPFTIATSDTLREDYEVPRFLHLYIRSYAGFTRRLYDHLHTSPDVQLEAWLDGPYGGHHRDFALSFDNIVLIAGGGGISAILPWLEYLTSLIGAKRKIRATKVQVHWSIRNKAAVAWIADTLDRLDLKMLSSQIEFTIHVTGTTATAKMSLVDKEIKPQGIKDDDTGAKVPASVQLRHGRLNFEELFSDQRNGSRTVCVACGPESLKVDLSNACARAQRMVIGGQLSEIALYSETFGW